MVPLLTIPGAFSTRGLRLEENPITSVYLTRRAGRLATAARKDHTHQTSVTLVAHKTTRYVCNGGGVRAERERRPKMRKVPAPRMSELEDVGVVLSLKHPPTSTYLDPAAADYCITRCVLFTSRSRGFVPKMVPI